MPNPIVSQLVQGGGRNVNLPFYGQQQGGVEQLLGQLRNMGIQGLQNPQQAFQPIAESARRGFQQDTIPLLAERAASFNASPRSSGYQNSVNRAATNLELGLAGQQAQFGQQNIAQLLQMLQLGLRPSTENIYTPPGQGFGSSIAGGLGTGIGVGGTIAGAPALGSWLSGLGGGAAATSLAPNVITSGATAAAPAAGAGITGILSALASHPAFWPVLAALGIGGAGAYGLSKLSGD
jgi:hypothetical protein